MTKLRCHFRTQNTPKNTVKYPSIQPAKSSAEGDETFGFKSWTRTLIPWMTLSKLRPHVNDSDNVINIHFHHQNGLDSCGSFQPFPLTLKTYANMCIDWLRFPIVYLRSMIPRKSLPMSPLFSLNSGSYLWKPRGNRRDKAWTFRIK